MFSQEEHNSHLITEIYYRPELSVYAFTYFYTSQSVQKHTTYYNKKNPHTGTIFNHFQRK